MPKGRLALGAVILILLCMLLPLLFSPETLHKTAMPSKPSEIEFIISERTQSADDILVWLGGEIVSMPLEEYLVGVVAAEMPAAFLPEALKAQAVAARTYTMYKTSHGGCSAHAGADICTDSTHCQAYLTPQAMAKRWGSDARVYLDKITDAVYKTRGEMIYYEGEQIQVFYHASSGGRTENSENVYSNALPYLKSVESVGEESSSNYYGEATFSLDEFKKRMRAFSKSICFENTPLIGDLRRFDSGRVSSIQIGSESFTGREIRGIFGLNSANFSVKVGQNITFLSVGFGHGVGLSQTGANAMAKKGADYKEILTHYFSGVIVQ